jgi:hypothetical protein
MTEEEALSLKLEALGISQDIISSLNLKGLIFNAVRRFDRYEMYLPGDTFSRRLINWLSNFSPEDRPLAIQLVKNIRYISRNELRALAEFALELASTLTWDTVIRKYPSRSEESLKAVFDNEIKRNVFVAVSDDIGFDYLRRKGRRRFPQLEKENFVEYYKMGRVDISEIKKNVASIKRFFLLDQFCGSGTSAFRFEGNESKGKLRGFFRRWRSVAANAEVYYVPLIASAHVKSLLTERLNQIPGDPTGILEVKILPLLVVPPSEWLFCSIDGKKSIDESAARLLEKYYDRFQEDIHTQKGGGCLFGLGAGGLSLIIGTNCPNNSLYIIWHSYGGWDPLFPRVAHHRPRKQLFQTDPEEQKEMFIPRCQQNCSLSALSRCTIVELKDVPNFKFDLAASIDPKSQHYHDLKGLVGSNWKILESFYSEEAICNTAAEVQRLTRGENMAFEFRMASGPFYQPNDKSKHDASELESDLIVPFLSVSGPILSPPSANQSEDSIVIPALMFPLSGKESLDFLLSLHAEYIDGFHIRTEKMLYLPAESSAIAFHRTIALLDSYHKTRGIDFEKMCLMPGYDATSVLVVTAVSSIWDVKVHVNGSLGSTSSDKSSNLILTKMVTSGERDET